MKNLGKSIPGTWNSNCTGQGMALQRNRERPVGLEQVGDAGGVGVRDLAAQEVLAASSPS